MFVQNSTLYYYPPCWAYNPIHCYYLPLLSIQSHTLLLSPLVEHTIPYIVIILPGWAYNPIHCYYLTWLSIQSQTLLLSYLVEHTIPNIAIIIVDMSSACFWIFSIHRSLSFNYNCLLYLLYKYIWPWPISINSLRQYVSLEPIQPIAIATVYYYYM